MVYSHRNIWHNAQGHVTNSTSLGIPLSSCACSSYNVQLARYSSVSLQCPVGAHRHASMVIAYNLCKWTGFDSCWGLFVIRVIMCASITLMSCTESDKPTATMKTVVLQLQVWDWNSLPADLRQTDIIFQRFKWLLKNFLFGCWDLGALWLTVTGVPRKFSYSLTQRFGWCCRRSCERELGSGVQRCRWERQSTVEPCWQRWHSADRGIGYRC